MNKDKPISKLSIKCECGAEILLVPDLSAIRKAIETHAEIHRAMPEDCSKTAAENEAEAEFEVERIKDYLFAEASSRMIHLR
jgi:hypothetical protein